jgi:hypothetical protein
MTRAQIEKVALLFAGAGEFGECPYNPDAKNGFIAGAQWRINSVWHDRAEKADTSKELILMYSNGSVRVTLLNPNLTFDGFLSVDMFIKWAYVSDLLPERKEETK